MYLYVLPVYLPLHRIYDTPTGSVLRIEPVRTQYDNALFTCEINNSVNLVAQLTVYQENEGQYPRSV